MREALMDVRRLGWLGTRTRQFAETTRFFRDVLGLTTLSEEPDFAIFGSSPRMWCNSASSSRRVISSP
jgi:catechol-2,3-dioxygenase